MKKRIITGMLIPGILCTALLAGCTDTREADPSEPITTSTAIEPSSSLSSESKEPPQYVPGTIRLTPSDITSYWFGVPHYRQVYYELLGGVIDSLEIDMEEFDQWQREKENASQLEPQEMAYVTLVKRFNVPKETFEKAVKAERQRFEAEGWDLTTEENELPNPDIIYTFDNEIINAYYERDDIYKPGEMHYTSEAPAEPPQYIPGSIQLDSQLEEAGFTPYRWVYYGLPGWAAYLVTNEELKAWLAARDTGGPYYIDGKPVLPDRMMLLDFIQDFDIPREDFAGARALAEERYTQYGIDLTQEENELPNTDVLYTFDENIINAYYLRSNG